MLLNSRAIVILTRRIDGSGVRRIITRGLFDTWGPVANRSLRFRGPSIRSEQESDIASVVIRTDATEEGDAVLRTQFLNQNSSINPSPHKRTGKNKPLNGPSSPSTTGARTVFRHRAGWRDPFGSTASESRRGGARLFLGWEVPCLPRCET